MFLALYNADSSVDPSLWDRTVSLFGIDKFLVGNDINIIYSLQ